MKIVSRLVLLALLAGLGFWLWTVLFPSPERIVLKRISSLASTATVGAGDGAITRAAKVSSIIGYFSADTEIHFNVEGLGARSLSGREEVREVAAGAMAGLSWLKVQFDDAKVKVAPDKQSAEVTCTARVSGAAAGGADNKDYGFQQMRFEFKKIDGDWLITQAETVKTLQ